MHFFLTEDDAWGEKVCNSTKADESKSQQVSLEKWIDFSKEAPRQDIRRRAVMEHRFTAQYES
jgi:hypothetical protein